MKGKFERLKPSIARWVKLLFEYFCASGIGQLLGLLSGLLYVRTMEVNQYALYGLCLTTLTAMSLVSDLGLTGSVTYFWRVSKEQGLKFSAFLCEIRLLRQWLLTIAVVLSLVAVVFVGRQRGYNLWETLPAFMMISITAMALISVAVNLQVMRLLGQFRKTYLVEITGQSVRFIFALLFLAGLGSSATFALAGGAVAAWCSWLILKKYYSDSNVVLPGVAPESPRKDLLGYIVPVAPTVAVFALQDTVIFWIAVTVATKSSVAEVFALGRILAVIGILNSFVILVMVPKISALSNSRHFFVTTFIAKAVLCVIGGAVVASCWLRPNFPLLLLGSKYSHLSEEVVIVALSGAFTLVNTATVLLNRAKGWVRLDWCIALIQIIGVICLCKIGDFSTALGVVTVSCGAVFLSLAVNSLVSVVGVLKENVVSIGGNNAKS